MVPMWYIQINGATWATVWVWGVEWSLQAHWSRNSIPAAPLRLNLLPQMTACPTYFESTTSTKLKTCMLTTPNCFKIIRALFYWRKMAGCWAWSAQDTSIFSPTSSQTGSPKENWLLNFAPLTRWLWISSPSLCKVSPISNSAMQSSTVLPVHHMCTAGVCWRSPCFCALYCCTHLLPCKCSVPNVLIALMNQSDIFIGEIHLSFIV